MKNEKGFMIIDDDADDRFFFKNALMEMLSTSICFEANGCLDAIQQLRKGEQLPDFIFLM